ncbi:MAG TPA: shikimate kinase [Candidatus Angelobacter sp.]|nr:shikimate kinase [Candidatus Angelobacter sp.]
MSGASAKTRSMRRIVLIGFMGAGKTTVGRVLAKRLRWPFFDLDDVIEQRERQTIGVIFSQHGETAFRRSETAALRHLLEESAPAGNLILALGGGAFVQPENRALLEQAGAVTVLLEAPLEELQRRCLGEHKVRPLAQQQERFAELFAARHADYQRAQYRVQTQGKPVEQVAAEIENVLRAVTDLEVPK